MTLWRKLFGPPDVAKLLRAKRFEPLGEALRDADAPTRSAAAAALGELGDPRAIPLLVAALATDDGELARAVGGALGHLGPAAIAPVGELLLRSRSFTHELTAGTVAMEALAAAHGPACASALAACLAAPETRVAGLADRLLTGLGDASLPAVILALRTGSTRERSCAADHLGGRGSPDAVGPLLEALGDAEGEVRHAAVNALVRLGDPRGLTALVPLLHDPVPSVARSAVRGLERLQDPSTVPPLIEALGRAEGSLLGPIASVLGRLGDARAVQPLLAALERADEQAVDEVAGALQKLNDRRAVAPLLRCLDARWSVGAMDALVHFGGEGVFEAVAGMVRRAERELRDRKSFYEGSFSTLCSALGALGRLRDPRGVPILLAYVESPLSYHVGDRDDSQTFHPVRDAARGALAAGGEPALAALRELLGDRKRRYVAVQVLAMMPEAEARETMLELLSRTGGQGDFGMYLVRSLERAGTGAAMIPAAEGFMARMRDHRDELQARLPPPDSPDRSFPYEDLRIAGLYLLELEELLRRLIAGPA